MTDSSNSDNDVQKVREIYEFPISLLRLFGINVTNLLGRRQFYRWLSGKSLFPSEITDLIEELMVKSIVEEKERKSGAGRLTWVISDRVEFDYFFEYEEVSPKTWVWLFYLNTAPDSLKLLTEQLVSKNIPDFRSLNLPFYSSETIIFLEKSAFGEVEISPSIIEKHLDKFLEINKEFKRKLLFAEYVYYGNDDESESFSDDENIPDVEESFWICENWFKGYIPTELKSKSLEKLYSDNSESKRTERKIKNVLSIKSAETGWSSEDPIFIVSKDLNALLKLWDSATEEISLKWREWINFLKKKEALDIKSFSFSGQELTLSQLFGFSKVQLKNIYLARRKIRAVEENLFPRSIFSSSVFVDRSPFRQILNVIINVRLEKCLIWLERLEKNEWEEGDEKKDWREWKKPEYGYQKWKHREETNLIQYLTPWEGSDSKGKLGEFVPYSEPEKGWEESFANLSVTDDLINSPQTTHGESHNMEKEEKNSIQEQILYQFLRDV